MKLLVHSLADENMLSEHAAATSRFWDLDINFDYGYYTPA